MAPAFYITTPIYYVNDAPHIGHAYTTIIADTLRRYHVARGQATFMLTGTDEHGEKIEMAAAKAGKTPKEFADGIVSRFRETWKHISVEPNHFIRTTDPGHAAFVTELWKRMDAAGDIYLGEYEGWYCVGCEAFYTDGQLDPGNVCPVHKAPVGRVKEPSFFFRMSRYQDRLLEHFEKHPEFVQPESRRNEVVSFIKSGLRDLSVSRTSFKWGIPVPGHPDHVIYVWLDALANYISALGGPGAELYERYWPVAHHLIGKDILRFHTVYWPTFLMSAGIPLPREVHVHGWWTVRGQKISKSLQATVVNPNQIAADIGPDPLRYFLLREMPVGGDGDFAYEALLGRLNSDLANDLGNLVNRTLAMTDKYVGGIVPPASPALDGGGGLHAELAALAARVKEEAERHFDAWQPSRALEAIWELVRGANRYVDASGPWALVKDPGKKVELDHVLHTFLEAVLWSALMVGPAMPGKSAEILRQLGVADRAGGWPRDWNRELPSGGRIARGGPVFPRVDDARQAELLARWIPPEAQAAPPEAARTDGTIAYDDFAKLDLRVGLVLAAERVPKSDKLLKLRIDLGGDERQVVAGIAEAYAPEALVGRRVIFLANLAARKIRGIESQGMILAAASPTEGERVLALLALDREVPAGTKIR